MAEFIKWYIFVVGILRAITLFSDIVKNEYPIVSEIKKPAQLVITLILQIITVVLIYNYIIN
jgi:hypothetical protein